MNLVLKKYQLTTKSLVVMVKTDITLLLFITQKIRTKEQFDT